MRMWLKRLVVMLPLAMVIALLLTMIVPSPSGAGSQTWYLTKTLAGIQANDGTTHSCDNVMKKELPTGWLPGMKLIGEINESYATAWWYSENTAHGDVTFAGEGNWQAELFYTTTFGSGKLHAEVWSVDANGDMDRLLASGVQTVVKHEGYREVTIDCLDYKGNDWDEQQTVLDGHRLALQLRYDADQWADGVFMFYGSKDAPANLQSHAGDPAFPTPELPTGILMSLGLLGLGGYACYRGRRSRRTFSE